MGINSPPSQASPFKIAWLSILPHLMITSAKKNQVKEEIVILTATSGDTGKAALAGFADVPSTRIIVFYPKDGVSPVQDAVLQFLLGKIGQKQLHHLMPHSGAADGDAGRGEYAGGGHQGEF